MSTRTQISHLPSAKILVVDDDQTFAQILGHRLEGAGYHPILANRGTVALEMLADHAIDLVLLDVMMPDSNGLDTLKMIRSNHSMAQLPVIMVTAKDGSEDTIEAFELGANDYVTKPIDLPVIMARIKSHLRTKWADRIDLPAAPLDKIEDTPSGSTIFHIPDTEIVSKLLLERYHITQQLSQDWLRKTYLARDTQTPGQPLCIVEQIEIKSDRDPEESPLGNRSELIASATYQWAKEVKAFQKIPATNIVKITTACKNKQFFYLIREYIEGIPLLDKIQTARTLSLVDVLNMLLEMLSILQTLHQSQLIHQHLQPNSFLYPPHQPLTLVDLGIADRLAASLEHREGQKVNVYQPYPQQGHNLTIRSDIYAVATITLQALTGLSPDRMSIDPTTGEIQWRHLRTVPEMFAQILDKMIARHPHESYHSVESILQDLHQLPLVGTLLHKT
jgi:CheY-like chemotaxis protein